MRDNHCDLHGYDNNILYKSIENDNDNSISNSHDVL